jgi:hypothetical protein
MRLSDDGAVWAVSFQKPHFLTSDESYTGMVRSRSLLVVVAVFGSVAFPAANDLSFQPIITGTKYCGEPGGSISLRLQLELRSQTPATVPLVLPIFAKVSAYELFHDETAVRLNHVESRGRFHIDEVLDAKKLNSAGPDPTLFRTVPIGEIAAWWAMVEIPVVSKSRDAPSLLGAEGAKGDQVLDADRLMARWRQ